MQGLKLRVWGAITEIVRRVKQLRPDAPGYIVDSEFRIYPTEPYEDEKRNPKDAIIGLACRVGDEWVGIGCFPPGTLIDTPQGQKPIEQIKPGDAVFNAIGVGTVQATQARLADRLVRIRTIDGREIVATPNHECLTRAGWKRAIDITCNDVLVCAHEAMRILQRPISEQRSEGEVLFVEMQGQGERVAQQENEDMPDLRGCASSSSRIEKVLLRRVCKTIEEADLPRVQNKVHTVGQPNGVLLEEMRSTMETQTAVMVGGYAEGTAQKELEGNRQESQQNAAVERSGAGEESGTLSIGCWANSQCKSQEKLDNEKSQRRESFWRPRSRGKADIGRREVCRDISSSEARISGSLWSAAINRIRSLLQARLRVSGFEARGGDRRNIARETEETLPGHTQGMLATSAGVASVEVLEPASLGLAVNSDGSCTVHNLTVSGHPSFVTSGLVVHNSYVGLHNDQVIGIFDEASLMPRTFWDATANLRKSPKTKFVALGNPKDRMDALGVIAEPAKEIGGWEGLGTPDKTMTWPAVGHNAIAIQLYGLDGPNFQSEKPKFPYLITPRQVEEDKIRYGEKSWQFQMMDLGIMPADVSGRRVITRALCERGNAFGEPIWDANSELTNFIGLDPAVSFDDGDRTAIVLLTVGRDIHGYQICAVTDGPLVIPTITGKLDSEGKPATVEDQIAQYVREYAQKFSVKPYHCGFDATGHGALAVSLARIWDPHVVPIEFGGRPPDRKPTLSSEKTERELYGKMVSALWFAARNAIVAGQIRGLTQSLFEEGSMREYLITKDGKEDVEPKSNTRKRLGKSPDLFDAFVAGLEVARRNGFEIGVLQRLGARPTRVRWLEEANQSFLKLIRKHDLIEA